MRRAAASTGRLRAALAALALAGLACSVVGPGPTLPPPPATGSPSPSPGPGTPTPRPETLTQPAATGATPATAATEAATPLPPLVGDVLTLVAPIGPNVPGTVRDLRFAPDGTLWLQTDQAVARLAGTEWELYLPEFEGELAGVDDYGRVWVAPPGGATFDAWDGQEWRRFGAAEGWAGAAVQGPPVSDQLGRVWVATPGDVRMLDGEQWRVFDRAALGLAESSAEGGTRFFIHAAARDGTVWVSACDLGGPGPLGGGGVRWLDGDTWQGAGTPLDSGCGGAVASSAAGPVWVGLDAALMQFDPESGGWTPHPAPAPPAGERFGYVADLALDPFEQAWPSLMICGGASCDLGLVRYMVGADGAWQQMGGPVQARQVVRFDVAGSGWLLSADGVQRAANGQLQSAGGLAALASAADGGGQIFVVAERDGEMALWLVRPVTE